MGRLTTGLAPCLVFAACTLIAAGREARVDGSGVLRWTDTGEEVSVFGVNYYLPFRCDFDAVAAGNGDFNQVMEEDVAHLRRLGLDSMRIHCFTRQFATHDGGFVANRHIEVLDRLISLCAANGIYVWLTPIAWWNGIYDAAPREGKAWTREQMSSDRDIWARQARFLREFGSHLNPFTGKTYAEDPAIIGFELVNEPLYPKDWPDEEVTAYVDTLAEALRASGTEKPIFYNSWKGRNAAIAKARIDGMSGSYYPTGLESGHALKGSQLAKIVESTLKPDESVARKAKMIYEFDCADTPGAYMYPAMARLFRHEGAQAAHQFQYDLLRLADVNSSWMTHHLNLLYTPAKALGLAIAAEAFRRLPRGCGYSVSTNEMTFGNFRVDAARNLSQMVTETDYLYTANPIDLPPAPEKLRRIWGVGASSVASATGNGTYFLDKAAEGIWRLQLYPDVFSVRDEFSGGKELKQVLLSDLRTMHISLPDLGDMFRVRDAATGKEIARAREGRMRLAPGDYVLENVAKYGRPEKCLVESLGTPAYRSRPLDGSPRMAAETPVQLAPGEALSLDFRRHGVHDVVAHVFFTARDLHGRTVRYPADGDNTDDLKIWMPNDASEWNAFDADLALRLRWRDPLPGVRRYRTSDSDGRTAIGLAARAGAFMVPSAKDHAAWRMPCDMALFRKNFPDAGRCKAVVFRARSADAFTDCFEFVFCQTDGGFWGCNVPLDETWRTIRIPIEDLKPRWGTRNDGSTRPDPLLSRAYSVAFGRWLYKENPEKPHGFELSAVTFEFAEH